MKKNGLDPHVQELFPFCGTIVPSRHLWVKIKQMKWEMIFYCLFRGEKTCFKDKERPGTKAEGLNLLKSKGKYIIRIKEECRQN